MKTKSLVLGLMTCFCCSSLLFAQGVDEEVKKFQGMWKVKDAEMRGEKAPAPVLKITFKFEKQVLKLKGPKDVNFDYKIDVDKSPRQIHLTAQDGTHKGKLGVGFFEFKKEELHLWIPNSPNGDDPPKDLEDAAAKGLAHFTLTKAEKAEDKPEDKKEVTVEKEVTTEKAKDKK